MTTQSVLKIGGMTCQGCVRSVTKVVAALPGVRAVQVSLDDAQALVTFDGDVITVDRMREAVEEAGFDAPV
jgi:copper chaperone